MGKLSLILWESEGGSSGHDRIHSELFFHQEDWGVLFAFLDISRKQGGE